MVHDTLPVGSFVRIQKDDLENVVSRLRELGYRTIGPTVADGAIIYDEVESAEQIPTGVIDVQDGGSYRLQETNDNSHFDYVVGPHSLKNYLFPSHDVILQCERKGKGWEIREPKLDEPSVAVIGPRSCDLHALRIQDQVFLRSGYVDPAYKQRRERLFVAAVNCRRAAATCFCHSMKTGPAVTFGYDLSLTELDDCFVVEVGSERGGTVITAADWTPCSIDNLEQARDLPRQLERRLRQRDKQASQGSPAGQPRGRWLNTTDIHELLMTNLDHPHWDEVAERCLACANCTMVCPTCFCSSVEEITDLTGDHVQRQRTWSSCFTAEHSYMNSGTVRKSTSSRYRQWLTHKLATWQDQFGTSGCIGCGRCITWCPVGIDLTEEVAAIRGDEA